MKIALKKTALCVCMLAALIMCGAAVSDRGGEAAVPERSAAAASADVGGYCLRDWQGYLAVFEGGGETPSAMTDIPTETLSLVDREKLRTGINAATREELLSLLEDFSS